MKLKELIKNVEAHTSESFDAKDRRHLLLLEGQIKRHYEDIVRKYNLIERVMLSTDRENDIYDNTKQYTRNR